MDAAKRAQNIEYKYTEGGIVVTADAATFELIKLATNEYYSKFSFSIGKVNHDSTDLSKSIIVQITYMVGNQNNERDYTFKII